MLPLEPDSSPHLVAMMDPYAAGYYGSTPEDMLSSLSGTNSLAELVSNPDSVPELIDSSSIGDEPTMVLASSQVSNLVEAQPASSRDFVLLEAQPASSPRVAAQPFDSSPTMPSVHGSSTGSTLSSAKGGSRESAHSLELKDDMEDGFTYPRRASPKRPSMSRSNLDLSSEPIYFPEWFDNLETSIEKLSEQDEDEDDSRNVPESQNSSSSPSQIEPLSPILPDLISLSDVMEGVFNTSKGKVAKRVLDNQMAKVAQLS